MANSSPRLATLCGHLRRELGVQGHELEDVAANLRANLSDLRDRMYEALRGREWEALSSMGYSLQGLGVNIAQQDLVELGAVLEAAAPGEDTEMLKAVVVEVAAVFEECGL